MHKNTRKCFHWLGISNMYMCFLHIFASNRANVSMRKHSSYIYVYSSYTYIYIYMKIKKLFMSECDSFYSHYVRQDLPNSFRKHVNNQTYTPWSTLRILNIRWFAVSLDHVFSHVVVSNAQSLFSFREPVRKHAQICCRTQIVLLSQICISMLT
jgi:hypothetical protein